MAKYIAFLRGINVGARVIRMAELKVCFERLGLDDVRTVLQTGNVIFRSEATAAELKQRVEAALTETFHYPAKVQVYAANALRQIVLHSPFTDDSTHHTYIVFFEDDLAERVAAEVSGLDPELETIAPGAGVIYWRVLICMTLKTTFAKYLTKAAYKHSNTNRNIKTLRKIINQV